MRFLADENVEGPIVRRLRRAGHDVRAIAEVAQRMTDPEVLRFSVRESRVLVTNDKDFAELVFLRRNAAVGIVHPSDAFCYVGPEGDSLDAGRAVAAEAPHRRHDGRRA